METHPLLDVRIKALRLHEQLNEKHASFIHSRHAESIRLAFAFQSVQAELKSEAFPRSLIVSVSSQDDGSVIEKNEAMLNAVYQLCAAKKARRNDFLVTMVKFFDVDFKTVQEDSIDVKFTKFVAENLVALDYKTVDEVMLVMYHINRIVSVTGEALVLLIEDYEMEGKFLFCDFNALNTKSILVPEALSVSLLAKCSASLGILCLLNAHLQKTFGIDE